MSQRPVVFTSFFIITFVEFRPSMLTVSLVQPPVEESTAQVLYTGPSTLTFMFKFTRSFGMGKGIP